MEENIKIAICALFLNVFFFRKLFDLTYFLSPLSFDHCFSALLSLSQSVSARFSFLFSVFFFSFGIMTVALSQFVVIIVAAVNHNEQLTTTTTTIETTNQKRNKTKQKPQKNRKENRKKEHNVAS